MKKAINWFIAVTLTTLGIICCNLFFLSKEWNFEKIIYLIVMTLTLTAPAYNQINKFLNNKL